MSSAPAHPPAFGGPRPPGAAPPRIGRVDVGLAGLSAVLLLLSFPRFDLGPLAWVALVPLLLALEGKRSWQAFGLAYVTGVIFFVGLFYWIWTIPAFNLIDGILVKALYLPQYVSLWGLALAWVRGRTGLPAAVVAPPLWVTAEYVRAHASFVSLPWMFLGHSQYAYPTLIQVSAVTGAYGLSFLIVLTSAALADLIGGARRAPHGSPWWRPRPAALVAVAAAALLLGATALYGMAVLGGRPGSERFTVALIQGNIPQQHKWDDQYRRTILDRYATLTRQAAEARPALIIWPESAVPGDVRHHPELRRRVARIATEIDIPLLVGSSELAKFPDRRLPGKYYNTMVLFAPRGTIEGVYRKMALVPFGEYVPLRDYVTWPKAIVSQAGDHLAGDQYTAFTAGPVTFRAVICWEIIFPDLVREAVKRGAAFLVLATNEGWFGDTAAPYQLLAMTVLRAAEHRIAIARSANTGVSAFIDPFGRITQRLTDADGRDLFVEGALVGSVPLARSSTLYTRYGDVFALLQIIASFALLLRPGWRPVVREHRHAEAASATGAQPYGRRGP